MTLGDIIKNLRIEKGLSQPEFSELAQIEQSYLSKLENNKSTPSADMFDRLLKAFNLTTEKFVSLFDEENLFPLQGIPQIKQQLVKQSTKQFNKQRRHLYISCGLIVMAITLFYTGFSKQLFSEVYYQYTSYGVIEKGEPNDIFTEWMHYLPWSVKNDRDKYNVVSLQMANRKDEQYIILDEYTGQGFETKMGENTRYYFLTKKVKEPQLINVWLQIIAVLLFSTGLMGFVIERRLYK